MIRLHDTFSRKKVELVPRDPGRVSIYVCGPTVYEVPHVRPATEWVVAVLALVATRRPLR